MRKFSLYFVEKHKYSYVQKILLTVRNLQLTFSNRSVKNVYFGDLVLWNNGDQFIDHSDFVESKPIVLISKGVLRFLASDIVSKSRPDLQFSTQVFADSVRIKMKGDEALEQGAGIAIRIFYTTENINTTDFLLKSRVKGTKQGFEYNDLKRTGKATHTPILLIGWSVIWAFILIRCVTLILCKKPVIFRQAELILLILALVIWSYYTYEYIYLSVDLPWFKG